MKQSSFRATCLILMACIAVLSAFGDEQTIAFETKILETFDNKDDSPYDWRLDASKFATKPEGEDPFPRMTYVNVWPASYFGYNPEDKENMNSLGIWGKFNRRGYNWIDVYPVKKGEDEATVIPVPGRIQYLDMWVWGSNLRYTLEAYFRDYRGVMHVINMGSLNYGGWKNLRAPVPAKVPQSKVVLPRFAPLEFTKFRIWTEPTEKVDNFYIYFKQFKILADTFETPYDGDELQRADRVQELWNQGGGE